MLFYSKFLVLFLTPPIPPENLRLRDPSCGRISRIGLPHDVQLPHRRGARVLFARLPPRRKPRYPPLHRRAVAGCRDLSPLLRRLPRNPNRSDLLLCGRRGHPLRRHLHPRPPPPRQQHPPRHRPTQNRLPRRHHPFPHRRNALHHPHAGPLVRRRSPLHPPPVRHPDHPRRRHPLRQRGDPLHRTIRHREIHPGGSVGKIQGRCGRQRRQGRNLRPWRRDPRPRSPLLWHQRHLLRLRSPRPRHRQPDASPGKYRCPTPRCRRAASRRAKQLRYKIAVLPENHRPCLRDPRKGSGLPPVLHPRRTRRGCPLAGDIPLNRRRK